MELVDKTPASLPQHPLMFATTFVRFQESPFADQIRVLKMPYVPPARHSNWDELRRVFHILKAAAHEKVLLLNSASGKYQPDTMALAILGLLVPKRYQPRIALMGDMWQPNSGLRSYLDRIVIKLADRAVDRYFVLSSEELEEFPKYWNLDQSKLRWCPYFYSAKKSDISTPEPPQEDFIFAGGNSHRDYSILLEVAKMMPGQKFVFATFKLDGVANLPSNVSARQVPHSEFIRLMRTSKALVMCIKKGLRRSSGQQTYLNAMFFRKPAIVNEVFGVRDHITDGVDSFIVDGSPQSYVNALHWILDPANSEKLEKMRAAARATAEHFSLQHHLQTAVQLVNEMIQDGAASPNRPMLYPSL